MSDPSFADFMAAELRVEALRSGFAGYFQKYDVLLFPVSPMTATPHGAQELVVNGVTVPYGFSSEGLPIGIQLVSRWLDEGTILRLGAMLERKGGLGDRRPNV